ncbi:histidine phosphatase family protein [Mycolicibacterium hodleri]|uniref:histidine phosphatase family protein n=1 Tax=Mycolicibacterium hodleri TaxID=49897 RepID=UPI001F470C53|nr:histidine phosphatase family protein [Mycolicibacterium hodleri]
MPGPDFTALGLQQAQDVATALAAGGHDGIYASTMVWTQQTAAPLAALTSKPVVVLPGLQEIGYGAPQLAWTLGLRSIPILGSIDGNAFDAQVDRAVTSIYDSGVRNPVVFSHSATIMIWVMMNVGNPNPLLFLTHPLGNTESVTVIGTPTATGHRPIGLVLRSIRIPRSLPRCSSRRAISSRCRRPSSTGSPIRRPQRMLHSPPSSLRRLR